MSLHTNPGGQIPPDQVIGRDRLIARLWRVLDRQSVVLTAERRMGKTSIVRKMVNEPPDDALYIFQDLEGVNSELEFVEKVFHVVERELSKRQRLAVRARQLVRDMGGTEVGSVFKLPEGTAIDWKRLLDQIVADLLEQRSCQSWRGSSWSLCSA